MCIDTLIDMCVGAWRKWKGEMGVCGYVPQAMTMTQGTYTMCMDTGIGMCVDLGVDMCI